ncbi:MAG TPA: TIGR04283 family arsenosugar biosynthesis glycosyltransferase [Allosphingosinicella sp.]|nr:TIGR04283 family arsenosugar biosynthesis glycosyltransferase [Allosphingosinicella sp.]
MTLSIVMPTFQEAGRVAAAVDAARALGADVEVIVVDSGSSDGTAQIARGRGARVIEAKDRGRARQMNQGAAAATGDVLLFLHADTILPPDARSVIGAILSDPAVAGGCFRLRFDDDHPVLRLSSALSSFGCRLFHYGDSAYFVRRAAFREIGGFHAMPLLEDLDFWLRLNRSHRVVVARASVLTSARRFKEVGVVRQQMLATLIVLLFMLGVGAPRLARLYHRFTRFRTPEVA